MPRAPLRNQHDGLNPPYVDCWRSGGAAKKLAGELFAISFCLAGRTDKTMTG